MKGNLWDLSYFRLKELKHLESIRTPFPVPPDFPGFSIWNLTFSSFTELPILGMKPQILWFHLGSPFYSHFFNCRNFIFRSGGARICPAREILNLASLYLARAWSQLATRIRSARTTTHCQIDIPRRHCRLSPRQRNYEFGMLKFGRGICWRRPPKEKLRN